MTVEERQRLEKTISRIIIRDAIAAGYTVSVDNGYDKETQPMSNRKEIIKKMFSVDEEYLHFHKGGLYQGYVFLVYGNSGWDVISDYSTSVEALMTKAQNYAEKFQ